MVKIFKPNRICLVTSGKYAGRKAVVVKSNESGTSARPFPHIMVVGIDRQPLKITRKMSQKKISKRSKIRPFVKYINVNHLMPTRYTLDIDFSKVATKEVLSDPAKRRAARKDVQNMLQSKYKTGTNSWFFTKLRF